MEKIIEQVGPSRQLFEAVNFAFMKIFDFLAKTAICNPKFMTIHNSNFKYILSSSLKECFYKILYFQL